MTLTKLMILAIAAMLVGPGKGMAAAGGPRAGGDPGPPQSPSPLGAKQYVDAGATNPKVAAPSAAWSKTGSSANVKPPG